jgi:hypothetical protein
MTGRILTLAACGALLLMASGDALAGDTHERGDNSRAALGLKVAGANGLDLQQENAQVGLGSYLVNAQGCNDCHTWPNFAPGHDPFARQPQQVNVPVYLAGGRLFSTPGGDFCSRNITPAPGTSKPAGLSEDDFLYVIRTGCDPQEHNFRDPEKCELLQIMPWPLYSKMTNSDLRAIYAYLRALPHANPNPSPIPAAAQCTPDPQGIAGE